MMRRIRLIKLGRLFCQSGTVVVVAGLCLSLGAGERLNIGGAKTRIQPGTEENSSAKINSARTLSAPSPYDAGAPLAAPRRKARDIKLDKKKQNERDERENWALLAPGELQQQEGEEFNFGVREYSVDDLEKKEHVRDYTFFGLDKTKNQDSVGEGQSSDSSKNSGLTQPGNRFAGRHTKTSYSVDNERENSGPASNPNPFRVNRSSDGSPVLGAHMSSELDFNGMLGPVKNTGGLSQMPGGSESALRSLLSSPISATQQDEHQQRMDSFRRMLGSGSSKPDTLSDPLGYPADRTRQSLNPVVPSAAQATSGSLSKQQLLETPNLSLPVKSPGLRESPSQFGLGRSSAFPDSPQPTAPQIERGSSQSFPPIQEVPRRKF